MASNGFTEQWRDAGQRIGSRIARAMELVPSVEVPDDMLLNVANTCLEAKVDGHRADIMMVRAARALAAWDGRRSITDDDLGQAARLLLPHRMRRHPLDEIGGV